MNATDLLFNEIAELFTSQAQGKGLQHHYKRILEIRNDLDSDSEYIDWESLSSILQTCERALAKV